MEETDRRYLHTAAVVRASAECPIRPREEQIVVLTTAHSAALHLVVSPEKDIQ